MASLPGEERRVNYAGPKDSPTRDQTVPPLPLWNFSVCRTPSPYLSGDKKGQRQQENGQEEHQQVGAISPQALPAAGHGVEDGWSHCLWDPGN